MTEGFLDSTKRGTFAEGRGDEGPRGSRRRAETRTVGVEGERDGKGV